MVDALAGTVRQGGWIMAPIMTASLVVWWLGLWKLYSCCCIAAARKRMLRCSVAGHSAPVCTGYAHFDRFCTFLRSGSPAPATVAARFKEMLLCTSDDMAAGITTIAVWVSVAPLLGLLGTVVGMIETFRIITLYGVGNPALTAEGISIALLTTQAGLTVAFPGLLLHIFIVNRKNGFLRVLSSDGNFFRQRADGFPGTERADDVQ